MAGFDDRRLNHLWCDGFRGHFQRSDDATPILTGIIWIGSDGNSQLSFEMVLPPSMQSQEDIVWKDLLPSDDQTAWLLVDWSRGRVLIDIMKGERIR